MSESLEPPMASEGEVDPSSTELFVTDLQREAVQLERELRERWPVHSPGVPVRRGTLMYVDDEGPRLTSERAVDGVRAVTEPRRGVEVRCTDWSIPRRRHIRIFIEANSDTDSIYSWGWHVDEGSERRRTLTTRSPLEELEYQLDQGRWGGDYWVYYPGRGVLGPTGTRDLWGCLDYEEPSEALWESARFIQMRARQIVSLRPCELQVRAAAILGIAQEALKRLPDAIPDDGRPIEVEEYR